VKSDPLFRGIEPRRLPDDVPDHFSLD
jgi:hypothetical protein